MRRVTPFLIAALAISACSPVYYNVAGVREAQASEVTNCTLIGRVSGIPGVYGPLKDLGLKDARRAAMEQAKAQGGNTVVFDPPPETDDIYAVKAQVYTC